MRPVEIDGIFPTEATIQDLSYPGARKMYLYVKAEHAAVKPAIRAFLDAAGPLGPWMDRVGGVK